MSLQQHATEIASVSEQSHNATSHLANNIQELAELSQSLKAVADQFKL